MLADKCMWILVEQIRLVYIGSAIVTIYLCQLEVARIMKFPTLVVARTSRPRVDLRTRLVSLLPLSHSDEGGFARVLNDMA